MFKNCNWIVHKRPIPARVAHHHVYDGGRRITNKKVLCPIKANSIAIKLRSIMGTIVWNTRETRNIHALLNLYFEKKTLYLIIWGKKITTYNIKLIIFKVWTKIHNLVKVFKEREWQKPVFVQIKFKDFIKNKKLKYFGKFNLKNLCCMLWPCQPLLVLSDAF